MTLMSESTTKNEILRLAKKFPSQLVRTIKKGNREEDYINHAVITQRLLQVLGAFSWDYEVIYEADKVVAVKGKIKAMVDGKEVSVSGTGTETFDGDSTGEKLKKMESDALKRAAARLGVGLHLWAQDQYFLDIQLAKDIDIDIKDIS